MGRIQLALLILAYLGTISRAGYIGNFPCSPRNTAHFTTADPYIPPDEIKCVDITTMGKTNVTQFLPFIRNADTLFADNMLLDRVPRDIVYAMPNIELIDLSRNRLRRLHRLVFAHLQNLKKVLLDRNKIQVNQRLPILKSASITDLILSNNGIQKLTRLTFAQLPSLKVLFLDGNKLKTLRSSSFYPLQNLVYLHIGNNDLKVIPPRDSLPKSVVTYIFKGNPSNSTGKIKCKGAFCK